MYTLGKLRYQIKSSSTLSECRQDKVFLDFERVQARESPSHLRVSSGKKKSFSPLSEFRQDKVLLDFERVQAKESPSHLRVSSGKKKSPSRL